MAAVAAGVIIGPAVICCCSSAASRDKTSASLGSSSAFHGTMLGPRNLVIAFQRVKRRSTSSRSHSLHVRAAKLPSGVEAPAEEPKLPVSLWGFTEKAEVWNSRAAMIGIFSLVALEFVAHRGILQMIGVDVGKGLDLPL